MESKNYPQRVTVWLNAKSKDKLAKAAKKAKKGMSDFVREKIEEIVK